MYSADKSHYPMKWNLIFKNDKLEDMYRRYNWVCSMVMVIEPPCSVVQHYD